MGVVKRCTFDDVIQNINVIGAVEIYLLLCKVVCEISSVYIMQLLVHTHTHTHTHVRGASHNNLYIHYLYPDCCIFVTMCIQGVNRPIYIIVKSFIVRTSSKATS